MITGLGHRLSGKWIGQRSRWTMKRRARPHSPCHSPMTRPSYALLKAVVMANDQPLSRRIRCAIAALPYEVPKLAVSSGGGKGKDFAAQLEAARRRSGTVLTLCAESRLIVV